MPVTVRTYAPLQREEMKKLLFAATCVVLAFSGLANAKVPHPLYCNVAANVPS
jgi:hypothetical protein